MNNLLNYNYDRGAWKHKHPPPTAKTSGESRFPLRSWTHRHPPPLTMTGVRRSVYLVVSGMQPTLKKQYGNPIKRNIKQIKKHRFRNRQAAENAAPRGRPKTIRYCGSSRPLK